MIKTYNNMNDYQTPRRRHSSLFQRMENQIHKISKKLSAAKEHRSSHTHSRKYTLAYPPSFDPLAFSTSAPTARKSPDNIRNSKQLTRKAKPLIDRTNIIDPSRAPVRRLRFYHDENEGHQVKVLMDQNKLLEEQVKVLRTVCEQQAFRMGYLRAQSRQRQNRQDKYKGMQMKEQIYLTKLAQGYRLRVEKYKKMLGQDESLELSVEDL